MAHPDLPTAIRDALAADPRPRAEIYSDLGYTDDKHGGAPVLSRWATGRLTPTVDSLAALVRVLGRPLRFTREGVTVTISPEK